MSFRLTGASTRASATSAVSRFMSSSSASPGNVRHQPGWRFPVQFRARSVNLSNGCRGFASEASQLVQLLQSELKHETSNYEDNAEVAKFLASGDWKLEEKEGDVSMVVTRTTQGKKVTVEFQLVSPFEGDNGNNPETPPPERDSEMTDFSVTVESKGSGVTFYCTTVQGNDEQSFRYMIGNVRYFANEADKNNVSAYNGPEFEDLDDSLQQGLDDWLASLGVNEALCDFIDAMSVDKEQREYMRWIGKLSSFLQS